MSGETEKPTVIGRATKLRSLMNIDTQTLLVFYLSGSLAKKCERHLMSWRDGWQHLMRYVLAIQNSATRGLHASHGNTVNLIQHMDQGVIKCVISKNCKLLIWSLLANMEAVTSATELANAISLRGPLIFLTETVELTSQWVIWVQKSLKTILN
jgi:hypothetical protein